MTTLVSKIAGGLEGKKRWRECQARTSALPQPYRGAVEALQRYTLRRGILTEGDTLIEMHDELVGVFEHAASSGTPLAAIVGEDPVAYADALLAKYAAGDYADSERDALRKAFTATAGDRA